MSRGGSEGSIGSILLTFLLQFSVGGLLGYAMGWLTVKFLNKANIGNEALYPILLLCAVFLTFSATTLLQGNGYLAVYIMGVVVGNKKSHTQEEYRHLLRRADVATADCPLHHIGAVCRCTLTCYRLRALPSWLVCS